MTRALIITITAVIALCAFPAGSVAAHPARGIVADRTTKSTSAISELSGG